MPWKKLALILVALAAIAYVVDYFHGDGRGASTAATAAPAAGTAVPVKSALATRGDVDLSLNVVARTEAWSTVTVRAQLGAARSAGLRTGRESKEG